MNLMMRKKKKKASSLARGFSFPPAEFQRLAASHRGVKESQRKGHKKPSQGKISRDLNTGVIRSLYNNNTNINYYSVVMPCEARK